MNSYSSTELNDYVIKLNRALERRRSKKWCLSLWSRAVKARDGGSCLVCFSKKGIQAHHVFRKTTFAIGTFEMGNGVTLCQECHRNVHAESNRKADLSQPLGKGDDQDEAAFLYGLLYDAAKERGADFDKFYHLSDEILHLFVRFQGYPEYFHAVLDGRISRIRMAHEIWRVMPEIFYENFVSELVRLNTDPGSLVIKLGV